MSDPRLAKLPAVHVLADDAAALGDAPRWAVVEAARRAIAVRREAILAGVTVEPVEGNLGRAAGEAIAATPGASVVDAIVMALAARLGATVFTSDVDDLEELRAFFPGVRVLSV